MTCYFQLSPFLLQDVPEKLWFFSVLCLPILDNTRLSEGAWRGGRSRLGEKIIFLEHHCICVFPLVFSLIILHVSIHATTLQRHKQMYVQQRYYYLYCMYICICTLSVCVNVQKRTKIKYLKGYLFLFWLMVNCYLKTQQPTCCYCSPLPSYCRRAPRGPRWSEGQ